MAHARYPVLFAMGPGGTTRHFPEHLGTAFLRAVLARAGIDSRQYLPGRNPSLTGFANFLREARPQVVGFTVYESNIIATRAMVRAVREALPDAVVAVGGPNATFSPEETLTLVDADVCQRGAGEGTIASLVHRILGSASPRAELPELLGGVPNLALRSPDGVHFTPAEEVSSFPARYFASLDDIPSPYQGGLVSTTNIGYLTARGCNQNCTYCSLTALSRHRVAFHSVERVLDDLAALEDLDRRAPRRTDDLWIFDDAFTLAPERARQICEGILERGIRLPFSCQTRGDRVTPDLLRLMRRAGFVIVGFGLESAVPRVLRAIGKVCPPDTAGDPQYER
ncbi:MAG: B12-binding domain-containing radical SAM protein, partial [Syntrophomonadaceae bacterium]